MKSTFPRPALKNDIYSKHAEKLGWDWSEGFYSLSWITVCKYLLSCNSQKYTISVWCVTLVIGKSVLYWHEPSEWFYFFKLKQGNLGHLLFDLITRQDKKKNKKTPPKLKTQLFLKPVENTQFREKLTLSLPLEVLSSYSPHLGSTARLHLISGGLQGAAIPTPPAFKSCTNQGLAR